MKKYLNIVMWCLATVAFCAFLIFLIDIASFDRVGKACSIWESAYYPYADTVRGVVLMANADMLGILVSLLILGILVLELFKQYSYWVWIIPMLGTVLFCTLGYNLLCFV